MHINQNELNLKLRIGGVAMTIHTFEASAQLSNENFYNAQKELKKQTVQNGKPKNME